MIIIVCYFVGCTRGCVDVIIML